MVFWENGKFCRKCNFALDKHGQEFPEYRTSLEYMEGVNSFMHNSPNGTLVKSRPNGDILKYDPKTNTFGVMDKNGNPRTIF